MWEVARWMGVVAGGAKVDAEVEVGGTGEEVSH